MKEVPVSAVADKTGADENRRDEEIPMVVTRAQPTDD